MQAAVVDFKADLRGTPPRPLRMQAECKWPLMSTSANLQSAYIVGGGAVRAVDDTPVGCQRYARDAYRMPVECK